MWYEDRKNLVDLANYLKNDGEWRDCSGEVNGKEYKDDPIKRLIYFLSKPWKWEKEWEIYKNTNANNNQIK